MAGITGQWLVKPALATLVALTVAPALELPSAVSTGIILVCLLSLSRCTS